MRRISYVQFRGGQPVALRWNRHYYRVTRVLDAWRETGEWWTEAAELWWWRVECDDLSMFEIGQRQSDKTWWMGQAWD